MVYDEGFEVKVGGITFFAFSGFDYFPEEGTGKMLNQTQCGLTERGWYQNHDKTQ